MSAILQGIPSFVLYYFIVSVAPIQPYRPPNRITDPTSTWMTVTTTTIEMILLFFKATQNNYSPLIQVS